jgi:hypothetical protein
VPHDGAPPVPGRRRRCSRPQLLPPLSGPPIFHATGNPTCLCDGSRWPSADPPPAAVPYSRVEALAGDMRASHQVVTPRRLRGWQPPQGTAFKPDPSHAGCPRGTLRRPWIWVTVSGECTRLASLPSSVIRAGGCGIYRCCILGAGSLYRLGPGRTMSLQPITCFSFSNLPVPV